jgi:hypothetical protein
VLTGGVGLLTDHRIAGGNWNHTALNEFGGGPQGFYVGWDRHDPTISFFFNSLASISTVWVHYDISNEGGVSGPGTVFINGLPFTSVLTGGTAPFWEAYSLPGTPASQLDFTTGHTGQWLMIDEIAFGTSAVSTIPEPTSMALLATAFGALGLKIRRRRTR